MMLKHISDSTVAEAYRIKFMGYEQKTFTALVYIHGAQKKDLASFWLADWAM